MSIFNYQTFSPYFRQYLKSLPGHGRGELSKLARSLRVSTTLVSQISAGRKTLTPEQAHHLIRYLGLNSLEADYLTAMVQFERAGHKDLQEYWKAKMEEIRQKALQLANRVGKDRQLSESERNVFYSSPLYSAMRLFASTGESGRTLEEICQRFEVGRAKASAIMEFLVTAGFCKEVDGRFKMGIQKTHLEQGSPHLLKHHTNWRLRAIRQAEELAEEELMYTVPVSLSRQDFQSLREQMVQFIEVFLNQVHASPAEEIACLNLDFFWIKK